MSYLNIFLFILALGLWSSMYLYKFKDEVKQWYLNKFDNTPPPLPPDGKIPQVSLPFNYASPSAEAESAQEGEKEPPAAASTSVEQKE